MTEGCPEPEGMLLYSVAEDWFFFSRCAQMHFVSMKTFHTHNILCNLCKETWHFAWFELETCSHLLLPRFCIGRDNEQWLPAHLFFIPLRDLEIPRFSQNCILLHSSFTCFRSIWAPNSMHILIISRSPLWTAKWSGLHFPLLVKLMWVLAEWPNSSPKRWK